MVTKGEIYVWLRKRAGKYPSRILCCVLRITKKNIEIVRWDPTLKKYAMTWASRESLIPASDAEKQSYVRQGEMYAMQAMQS